MFKDIYLKCFLLTSVMISIAKVDSNAQLRCKLLHYSTEDGLSHERITSMLKDREGFMWFGTWDGLNRFDGHNFISYKSYAGDKSGLKNNRIDRIVDDNNGHLWIKADDKRTYRFDKQTGEFLSLSALIGDNIADKYLFEKVLPQKDGSVWLISKNNGIFSLTNQNGKPEFCHFGAGQPGNKKLPADKVNFVFNDRDGKLWVGTSRGIACIVKSGTSFGIQPVSNLQRAGSFNYLSMVQDNRRHRLYFTTGNGALVIYDIARGNCQVISETNASLNNICVSRRSDVLYCSTSNGSLLTIAAADGHLLKSTRADNQSILSVYEDSHGLLWLEPTQQGVIKYDPNTGQVKRFSQKNDAGYGNGPDCYAVFEDKTGKVWVNMKRVGFGYYNTQKDAIDYFYNSPDPGNHHFSNIINCQYYDDTGILWLSTDDQGLEKVIFQNNNFHQKILVQNTVAKSDNQVRAIYHDRENRTWAATRDGKIYITKDDKPVTGLFDIEPTKDNFGLVYTILEDRDGAIWLGTKADGLYKADPVDKRRQHYKLTHFQADNSNQNSLSSNVIYSLQEDNQGRIWIGSYGDGLMMVSKEAGALRFYTLKNSFKNYPQSLYRKIRHLALDARGNLWLATIDGLLIADIHTHNMAGVQFRAFNKIPGDITSLGNNDVQYIFRDSRNTMWLATSGGGLCRAIGNNPLKSLTFRTFTVKDEMPSDFVLDICEDNHQNLWLATQNGISEFDASRRNFRNFDSFDGLPKNGFSESTALKLPGGHLMFGAVSGYLCFNPDSIIDHKVYANMALTSFAVNNQNITAVDGPDAILQTDINHADKVTLNYDQNMVDIGYSMLDYRSSNKDIYAYRLAGFDKAWIIDNKNQRHATYSHLPPGKYVFEVKSINDNLYLNKPAKSVKITVLPPLWATWWAYLIYAIIVIVLIELIRRTALTVLKLRERISVEKQLTDLKLNFFTNISHELRTPLTLIINPIEEISRKEKLSVKGAEHAQVIQKNARRMVSFINQLLDLRKMESGKASLQLSQVEVISFVRNIGDFFAELAAEKQMSLKIVSDLTELFAWVDAGKLDMVIYNLLANAFKFSGNGTAITLSVGLSNDQQKFCIRISDQGPGVPKDKLSDIFELYYEGEKTPGNYTEGSGIGLALAKEIVELHLGEIYAENNVDCGLSVVLNLHMGKEFAARTTAVFTDVSVNQGVCVGRLSDTVTLSEMFTDGDGDLSLPLILLVEDNADLRRFLTVQLSEHYRVAGAENGREGWEKALQLQPDLVLSDVMMPELNGIQLLDKLKNHNDTSHIPVVLLSARSAVENQIQGLKYGADYYITKPFSNKLVLTLVANLIKQRKQLFENLTNGQKVIELGPSQITITSKDEVFLQRIIEVVEDGMVAPNFNIENVAESIGMGRSAFYKKFKSLTNLTPVEFVRDMRLKRGMQFLETGETDIARIAYAVGFSDPKYFSVCFKKQYDISPSEYVKSKKLDMDSAV